MSKKDKRTEPMIGTVPKTKRRAGVMPTRKEEDKRRRARERPERFERATGMVAFYSQ